jgi:hypothetical protein
MCLGLGYSIRTRRNGKEMKFPLAWVVVVLMKILFLSPIASWAQTLEEQLEHFEEDPDAMDDESHEYSGNPSKPYNLTYYGTLWINRDKINAAGEQGRLIEELGILALPSHAAFGQILNELNNPFNNMFDTQEYWIPTQRISFQYSVVYTIASGVFQTPPMVTDVSVVPGTESIFGGTFTFAAVAGARVNVSHSTPTEFIYDFFVWGHPSSHLEVGFSTVQDRMGFIRIWTHYMQTHLVVGNVGVSRRSTLMNASRFPSHAFYGGKVADAQVLKLFVNQGDMLGLWVMPSEAHELPPPGGQLPGPGMGEPILWRHGFVRARFEMNQLTLNAMSAVVP